jgi:hypothetical protein
MVLLTSQIAWTGLGNPQGEWASHSFNGRPLTFPGGLVFTNAFSGSFEQTHEWTSFMASGTFCFRACRDGPSKFHALMRHRDTR